MVLSLDDARRAYAEEIRAVSDLQCGALVEALARVPREDFVGPGPWLIVRPLFLPPSDDDAIEAVYRRTPDADPRHLYHNVLVAIDPARKLNHGQPSANSFWIDALAPRPGERVVHVGCGVGYYTAIVAETVGAAGSVLAVDVDPELASRSRANLRAWPQVEVVTGDGATLNLGAFDVGYVNAGATRLMPSWLAGVRPGGRLLVPLTAQGRSAAGGYTLLLTRSGERWAARFIAMVGIFPCSGARDEESAAQLRALYQRRAVHEVRSLRRDPHDRDPACAVHLDDYCLSTLPPA